eukprot:7181281-Prorocentrum_lima.AAC.1
MCLPSSDGQLPSIWKRGTTLARLLTKGVHVNGFITPSSGTAFDCDPTMTNSCSRHAATGSS